MKEKARMKSDSPSGLASYCSSVMFLFFTQVRDRGSS